MIRRPRHRHLLAQGATWGDSAADDLPRALATLATIDAAEVEQAVSRSRSRVLAAFRATAPMPAPTATIHVGWLRAVASRTWTRGLVTAIMVVAMAGAAIAESAPGQPFYEPRVALEALLLPREVDARLASQLDRLDRRIAEAEAAGRSGDDRGPLSPSVPTQRSRHR